MAELRLQFNIPEGKPIPNLNWDWNKMDGWNYLNGLQKEGYIIKCQPLDLRGKEKMTIVLSSSDGWEGFYIDGVLVDEGNPLNEGEERLSYFLRMADDEKHPISIYDIEFAELNAEDDDELMLQGNYPVKFRDLKGNYDI